ncbi:MAG TPA: hypothetical protein VNK95_10720, partial [Caldilineaceae bacterium]|nr:hypothetical protein [Caldilineaceae bacterium]
DVDEGSLGVYYLDEGEGQWKPLTCQVDTANNQVSCQADHFTEFALAGAQTASPSGDQSLFLPLVP